MLLRGVRHAIRYLVGNFRLLQIYYRKLGDVQPVKENEGLHNSIQYVYGQTVFHFCWYDSFTWPNNILSKCLVLSYKHLVVEISTSCAKYECKFQQITFRLTRQLQHYGLDIALSVSLCYCLVLPIPLFRYSIAIVLEKYWEFRWKRNQTQRSDPHNSALSIDVNLWDTPFIDTIYINVQTDCVVVWYAHNTCDRRHRAWKGGCGPTVFYWTKLPTML